MNDSSNRDSTENGWNKASVHRHVRGHQQVDSKWTTATGASIESQCIGIIFMTCEVSTSIRKANGASSLEVFGSVALQNSTGMEACGDTGHISPGTNLNKINGPWPYAALCTVCGLWPQDEWKAQ